MAIKGQVPAHIKPKEFHHPQPTLRLIRILDRIPDPRKPSCNFEELPPERRKILRSGNGRLSSLPQIVE